METFSSFIFIWADIIFDKMNRTIPFTDEEDKEISTLYKPVKAIVPLIFPNLIVNGKPIGDEMEEDEVIIDHT